MSKLTPWFPADIKPVREGVYETTFNIDANDWAEGYSYWTGKRWANQSYSVERAHEQRDWTDGAVQQKRWRGLKEVA